MKIKIIPTTTFRLEIDGHKIAGDFKLVGEWENMMKLECSGPCACVIIKKPFIKHLNAYDFLPALYGGNREANKHDSSVETECVSHDISELLKKQEGASK